MEKRKHISIALAGLLVLLLAAALWAGLLPSARHAYAEAEWEAVEIAESYNANSSFAIPSRTVRVNGKTVRAEGVLVYPDGTATVKSPSVLDQAGTYSVRWSAEADGQPYAEEESFIVYYPALWHGENTTVGYGVPALGRTEGILVHLAQDETLTFMNYIDVSELSAWNSFVEFYVYPETQGVADMDAIVFTLTDAEDPDIYVKIRGHRYINHPGLIYYSAGFNGGPMKGYEGQGKNILHEDNEWGMAMPGSFEALQYDGGAGASETADGKPVFADNYIQMLSFDAGNMGVFGESTSKTYTGQIIDLDNREHFDALFGGFPSGKVFLSVSGEGFRSASANICFTKVLGTDFSEYDAVVLDQEKPVITVENPYAEMPEARVGGSYPVFSASAQDIYSGACEVKTSVWYNYGADSAVRIEIADGRFETKRAGWYTIVYQTSDAFGNDAAERLWVHAGGAVEEMHISLAQDAVAASAELGSWVELPPASSVSVTGGSGVVTVTVSVSHGDETYAVKDGFRPEQEGEWTVLYTATDITGKEVSLPFVVDARPGDKPVLAQDPVLPPVFIAGVPYALEEVYAVDYSSGSPERVLPDIAVEDASGERVYRSGEAVTFSVGNSGDTVCLEYRYGGVSLARREVPVILAFTEENGTPVLHTENYFYGEGLALEKTLNGMLVSAEAGSERAEWTFANALLSEFSLVLTSVPGSGSFGSLRITLTDAAAPAVSVSAQIRNSASGAVFTAGGTSVALGGSFMASAEQQFSIGFSGTSFIVNGVRVAVSETDAGEAFSGFSTGMVYLRAEMSEIGGAAAYKVVSVNDHPFTESTRDHIAPKIAVLHDYGGSYSRGETYTIGGAFAADVLSPSVTFELTVRGPDGQIVTDTNGVRLEKADPTAEHTIVLEQYGQYRVSYTALESSAFTPRPQSASFGYAVNVEDVVAPQIELKGTLTQTAKVGDVIILPAYSVTDNETPAEEIVICVYVLNPNGVLVALKGNAFKPSYAGVYEFRITAADADGNMEMVRLRVTVFAEGEE